MAPDQELQEGRPCIVRELLSRLSDTGLEGHALAEEEDLVRNVAAVAFVGEHRQFSGASAGSSFLITLMHVAGADTVSWTHNCSLRIDQPRLSRCLRHSNRSSTL